MKSNVILVDDDPAIQFGYKKYFSKTKFRISSALDLAEAHEALSSRHFDVLLLDLYLPDGKAVEHISQFRNDYPEMAIVVITGDGDIPVAVESMRMGADNFLTKPVSLKELEGFLQNIIEKKLVEKSSPESKTTEESYIYFGTSKPIRKVMELAGTAAENDSAVLLTGETGSGKGILAQWIHDHSRRKGENFVSFNCSSLKGEMLANELFGHVKGAYTSAVQDRQGLLELADGGTLFLDEVSNMSPGVQADFLKVIEEKQFRRLGENKVRKSDFRLICSTNKDLLDETRQERFRKDLYFRINVFPIELPPLRKRLTDLPGLVHCFLNKLGVPELEVSEEVMQKLKAYSWPGNIRELRNSLERAILLARGCKIMTAHFPDLQVTSPLTDSSRGDWDLKEREIAHILQVIDQFGGNKAKAAEVLGISKAILNRKLKSARRLSLSSKTNLGNQ